MTDFVTRHAVEETVDAAAPGCPAPSAGGELKASCTARIA